MKSTTREEDASINELWNAATRMGLKNIDSDNICIMRTDLSTLVVLKKSNALIIGLKSNGAWDAGVCENWNRELWQLEDKCKWDVAFNLSVWLLEHRKIFEIPV